MKWLVDIARRVAAVPAVRTAAAALAGAILGALFPGPLAGAGQWVVELFGL